MPSLCSSNPTILTLVPKTPSTSYSTLFVSFSSIETGTASNSFSSLKAKTGACVGMCSPNREEGFELDSGILEMQGSHLGTLLKQILKMFGVTLMHTTLEFNRNVDYVYVHSLNIPFPYQNLTSPSFATPSWCRPWHPSPSASKPTTRASGSSTAIHMEWQAEAGLSVTLIEALEVFSVSGKLDPFHIQQCKAQGIL
ncbi:hypothetical protein DFQ27_003562 [Actinomortierella ambigua]|uniref:Uncharacterized protein n=1 Tax=Actinomortierella ambigua TaxID=1343610 RepID=A0A9P6UCR0_9FUNG|nr:hypothetical protein DFQ27_003562 [Actinomortierella ambigua]